VHALYKAAEFLPQTPNTVGVFDTLRYRCNEQGRIKGGVTAAIAPGPPLEGGPRDEIYLFQIKYSFEIFL